MNGMFYRWAALALATGLSFGLMGCAGLKDKPVEHVELRNLDLEQKQLDADQLNQIKRQVKRGEKIEDPNLACQLLFMAALSGNDGLITALINNGVDLNVKGNDGMTALHTAALEGNKEAVKRLLKHGADVNAREATGATVLYDVVDNEGMVKLLLDAGANPNMREEIWGFAPLHGAAREGKIGIVKLLIAHKADVDAKSKNGHVPLHLAAQQGNLEVVKALLDAGADPNARSKAGISPYKAAEQSNKLDAAQLIHEYGGD